MSESVPPPPSSRELRRVPHRRRGMLEALFAEAAPLDLRLLGRVLVHATLVGALAGLMASAFYYLLETGEEVFIDHLAGYPTPRAAGERLDFPRLGSDAGRWWLLWLLPPLGALAASALTRRLAPECEGSGADAVIRAFHQQVSDVRRRVMWIKPIATVLTLATGGAGGREGPTMHVGGSIGSLVARYLDVSQRERRILLVAGMAAGTSAIFRTPLGAALLAVEILYRDDFESDALVPAVLASVVGYSVFIAVHGDATLFAVADAYPFVISHLPLYALMTLVLAAAGHLFVRTLRSVEKLSSRWPGWARAAIGGLVVGILATVMVLIGDSRVGIALLGGGYGAAQAAISGADWLPSGMQGAFLLLLLGVLKMVAASFTVGSGGSAGVFAPTLAAGSLIGGAYGKMVQYVLDDPSIQPGAFALVGMGTLYGGIAHAPLGALVMVCELAGSYDLLVPLMLGAGIAFVTMRRVTLYPSQPTGQHESLAHPPRVLDVLKRMTVAEVMIANRPFASFSRGTPVTEVMKRVYDSSWQDVFPVVDDTGKLVGMITPELLRLLWAEREMEPWVLAVDAMQPPVTVRPSDDLRLASERMLTHGLRELLVVEDGAIRGFIDEAEIGQIYLDRMQD